MLISTEQDEKLCRQNSDQIGVDCFEFMSDSKRYVISMDENGIMKCPFCYKEFQRLAPHLKSNKFCSSLVDFDSFKESFDHLTQRLNHDRCKVEQSK